MQAAVTAGSAAERSYPTSEVRGNGLECQSVMAQEGVSRDTHVRGQGWWPGRSTHVQGAVAALAQEGLEELSHIEVQEGWG